MAERAALFESFLNCHVCSETFNDPVTLSCNHSFCWSCLQKFWELNQNKNCPICKRKSSKEDPAVNLVLKELADSFAGRQKSESSETKTGEQKIMDVCGKHSGETNLFCKDERKVFCAVCEFSLHQSHKVVPVEEAVRELKEKPKDLKSPQDKKMKYKEVEETTKEQIRAEFNKLHQILKEEEESRLAALSEEVESRLADLRKEEEQSRKPVSREMKRIQEQMSSLSESISAVEAERQEDKEEFLSSSKDTQSRARAQSSLSDPQLLSGALIDVVKHVGNLSFRVWEKMKEKVHFSPVLLDPNTANGKLHLSDDLTSVSYGETSQQLPDNPERNMKHASVFGSEGFRSGEHIWDVEVGDHPHWIIGVAKESVNRKGECSASPKDGFWCLINDNGKFTNGVDTVTVKKSFQKIRVRLEYNQSKVFFYAVEPTPTKKMTLIYTHKDISHENLFPFFSVGESRNAKTSKLQICPTLT